MAIIGENISSGLGSGEAQVFKPYRSDYGAEVAKIGQQKRKEENARQEDIYSDLGKIKTDGIFFKHKPIFAQKQAELYDYVKKNVDKLRKGDAQATIEFHDRLNQLGTDIGLSKNVAESYTTAGKDYMSNPDKYRPEVLDKLHSFEGYNKETGQFENVDPSIMQQHTDLAKNFNQTVLPNLKESIQEGKKVFDLGGGRISTDEFKKLPETIVRNKIDAWITDPVIHEQAYYDYKKANPQKGEPSIDDLKEDLYQKYGASLVKDEHKRGLTEGWKPDSDGDKILKLSDIKKDVPIAMRDAKTGKDVQDIAPAGITLPSDLNLNIPVHSGILSNTTGLPITAPVLGSNGKPILLDENGEETTDESEAVKIKTKPYVGQLDITGGGDVNIGKIGKLKGGKSEYGVFLYAKAKTTDGQDINVKVPIKDVKGYKEISKQKSVIEELERRADELNKSKSANKYTIKGKTYSHEELNKMGYSDEQIELAKKAGTIK